MKSLYLFLSLLLCSLLLKGQSYDFSQNSPLINWKIIKTDNYKIIYPAEIKTEALRVANTLEYLHAPLNKTLNANQKPWTLVLSTQGAQANGYVALAPRRSEWYSAPPQGNLVGTGEWYNLLASHEGRHMIQYDKFNHGLTKLASFVMGQSAVNALSFFSVPMWYWEGDAVSTETSLSGTGRGRIPDFDIGVRTLLISGINYSYYKAYMRSFKDYFPNHYTLGYFMVSYVKTHYPAETWSVIADQTSNFSVSPFRFSRFMRKTTGFNARLTYNKCMLELDSIWRNQISEVKFTEVKKINTEKKVTWTNYSNIYDAGDGTIICLKDGMSDPSQIIRINILSGEETLIKIAPVYEKLSYVRGKVCYNEYQTDKRWANQNYSNLCIVDVNTKKSTYLSKKGRFFAAELSPDAKKIAAVEFTTERKCYLVIIDASTGEVLKRYQDKENEFIQTPYWSEDGKLIVYTHQNSGGKILSILNTETREMRDLTSRSHENISNPIFIKDFILYESPYSGVDNIYAINYINLKRYQVCSRKFGCYNPSISSNGNTLYFLDYDVKGKDLVSTVYDPSTWIPIDQVAVKTEVYIEPWIKNEQNADILSNPANIPKTDFAEKDYKQAFHLLNFHSWTLSSKKNNLGLTLNSRDILNTTAINIGTTYCTNEKKFFNKLNFTYAGKYPVIMGDFEYGTRSTKYIDSATKKPFYNTWQESGIGGSINIPYLRTKGAWTTQVYLSVEGKYTEISGMDFPESDGGDNGKLFPLSYRFTFVNSRMSAWRDLVSPWSQAFSFSFNHTPFKNDYQGSLLSLNGQFYFPGLVKHHTFQIETSYEKQNPISYVFGSESAFSRGYNPEYNDLFVRAAGRYEFPLSYPDLSFGALINCKRIRGGLHYDWAYGNTGNIENYYRSAGVEVTFDLNFLNFPFDFNLGGRYSYLYDLKKFVFKFILLNLEF